MAPENGRTLPNRDPDDRGPFPEPFPDGDVTHGTGPADDGTAVSHDSGTTRDSTFTLAGGESSTGSHRNLPKKKPGGWMRVGSFVVHDFSLPLSF